MTVVATMNEETVIQVKNFRTRELATLIRYEGKQKNYLLEQKFSRCEFYGLTM